MGVAFDGKQYFVVWQDEREGEVYGARVRSDGKLLDPGGIPLNLETGLDGGDPRVAWDGKQFVVVWVSGTDGIFGARVGRDGQVRGHFIIGFTGEAFGPPGIACARHLCLVAYDISGTDEDVIVAARVDSEGDVLGRESLSPGENFAVAPAVAWDGRQFLVVWSDERGGSGTADIYGARVKKDGTVLDPDGVPIIALPGQQAVPDVTWTGSRFLVVWEDDRSGTPDILGARVRRDLSVDGSTGFPISTGPGVQAAPRVAPSGSKSLVVWQDSGPGAPRARGVRVGDDGSILGDPSGFTLSAGAFARELLPAVAAGNHQFFVAYAGMDAAPPEFGPAHILGTRVTHDDTVKDRPPRLFTRSAYPQDSAAAAAGAGSTLVVWRETREGTPGLLAARVSPDGRMLGAPLTLPAGPEPRDPAVAWDGDAWLVVWSEEEPGGGFDADIRGARVSGAGLLLDAASLAIAELPEDQSAPAVASNRDGFLVVWADARGAFFGNASDIVGTRVSSGGAVLDPGGFRISGIDFTQGTPSVVAAGSLHYLVAWTHFDFTTPGDTELGIRGARVAPDGTVLDTPERLFVPGPVLFAPPALAFDGTNTLLAWSARTFDSTIPGSSVLAIRVDASGAVLDSPPIAVATRLDRDRLNVTAAFDGTDFWLAWEQTLSTPPFPEVEFPIDVYGARVRTSGTVRDPGGRALSANHPEPEHDPVLVAASGRVLAFYTAFDLDEDVVNLRIQGRVLTGLGSSAMGVAEPEAEAR